MVEVGMPAGMELCVCIYIYICMRARMYTCMHVLCMYVCMYVRVYVCPDVRMHMCAGVGVYAEFLHALALWIVSESAQVLACFWLASCVSSFPSCMCTISPTSASESTVTLACHTSEDSGIVSHRLIRIACYGNPVKVRDGAIICLYIYTYIYIYIYIYIYMYVCM